MTWRCSAGSPGPEYPGWHRQTQASTREAALQAAGHIADGKPIPVYVRNVLTGEALVRQPGGPWQAVEG